jgi:hypothetical protein
MSGLSGLLMFLFDKPWSRFLPLVSFASYAGMQRAPGYLAHRVSERLVRMALGQGLQYKHRAALLWPHGNSVRNRVTQQLIHRPLIHGIRWV